MKLRAQLHNSLEKFMLFLNEEPFYELPRCVSFATPSSPDDEKDKITTKSFRINKYSVVDANSSKSLTAIDALIESAYKCEKTIPCELDLRGLQCSDEIFIGLFECFYKHLSYGTFSKLIELTLVDFSSTVLCTDEEVFERFGSLAQTVKSLTVGALRQARPETKQMFFLMIHAALKGRSTP